MRTAAARAARPGLRSPRFRRVPCARGTVSDPGRATGPRVAADPHMLPSTKRNVSASASSQISWLNPAPHALVVYASRQPSPTDVQHSLPGGRYPLPERDFHPLDHASFSWRTRFLVPACTMQCDGNRRRALEGRSGQQATHDRDGRISDSGPDWGVEINEDVIRAHPPTRPVKWTK